ncbi:response regulator transcription factor [Oerskovia sp. M15]
MSSARILGPLVVALTHVQGQVPDDVLAPYLALADHEDSCTCCVDRDGQPREAVGGCEIGDVVRGLTSAATLHAERATASPQHRPSTRQSGWRGAAPRAWAVSTSPGPGSRTTASGSGRGAVRAGAGLTAEQEAYAQVGRAIALADGDALDVAGQALASAVANLAPVRSGGRWFDTWSGAVTPYVEAHLRLAQVLVHFWSGNITRARRELEEAAFRLPVGLPFAGLGSPSRAASTWRCTGASGRSRRRSRRPARARRRGPSGWASSSTGPSVRRSPATTRRQPRCWSSRPRPTGGTARTCCTCRDGRRRGLGARGSVGRGRTCLRPASGRGEEPLPSAPARDARPSGGRPGAAGRHPRAPRRRGLGGPRVGVALRARAHRALPGRALVRWGDPAGAHEHLLSAIELLEQSGARAWARHAREELARFLASLDLGEQATEGTLARPDRGDLPPGRSWTRTGAAASGANGPRLAARESDVSDDALDELRGRWSHELTERELDVALLVVQGGSNREAAEQLYLSVRTVEVHLGRVFRKLGVRSRVELAVLAHRVGR